MNLVFVNRSSLCLVFIIDLHKLLKLARLETAAGTSNAAWMYLMYIHFYMIQKFDSYLIASQ